MGNGASMAAVCKGKSVDTTMSFTPTAGLVMSTRSGDLDPGLFAYFARSEGMTPPQFNDMVNTKSGLLGISETSSDVRDLEQREKKDPRAAEALEIFCYQARKWIGALSAALGGLETLVFSGGIGENSAPIRARICRDLKYLGIELDPVSNKASAPVINPDQEQGHGGA
jgi:acetate kinase